MIGAINLYPSKLLAGIISLLYLGAFICVLFLGINVLLQLALMLLIVLSCYMVIKRYALLQSKKSIVSMWHKEASTWYLQNRAGYVFESNLRANSFVSRYMTILNFIVPVVMCVDSLTRDKSRLLRVHLQTNRA